MTCPSCGSDKTERNGYCASCNFDRRREERKRSRVKVSTPVNQVSPKRAGQLQEYAKLRKDYLALYPICEVENCEAKSTELHHQAGREGERLLDSNYFMAVCAEHHRYYTENSKEAIEKGISFKRTS
jgi:hypothetical protein